ncbi:GerMN domain-containing protein [Citricoccus nitrophenolicus]|uniref:Sporulation and spore germination protein n=1 Tax=Citricoccus muralis TaxID=169134 RepID=A0A3D9LFF3_9MICC|nr:GerMN domain-containing protein [Citricoccus muralis]REE04902.1 sporulation and spore germination protein [Citricoccus muralis]
MSQTRTARRPFLVTAALTAVLSLGLTACGTGGGEASESPTTSPSDTASASASATESMPATESATPSDSATASPSASSAPSGSPSASASGSASGSASASETAQGATEATVYWVAMDNLEGIEFPGCGDSSLMESTAPVSGVGDVGDPSFVEAGLQVLLDQSEYEVGSGLTNSLYQSELEVTEVSISGDTVTVDLTGTPISSGTCDDPRIIAQLENTALANAGVYAAQILLDGTPIQEAMSQKGA